MSRKWNNKKAGYKSGKTKFNKQNNAADLNACCADLSINGDESEGSG